MKNGLFILLIFIQVIQLSAQPDSLKSNAAGDTLENVDLNLLSAIC